MARLSRVCPFSERGFEIPGRTKSRACRWSQRFNHTTGPSSPALTSRHHRPRSPSRPPLHRSASARTPASTAAFFAWASSRVPPTPSAAVDPRGRDAKRSLPALSPTAARSLPRPRASACTSHHRKVQYSCRSTLPNASDWTRQEDSHRLLRPLTSPPRRAAIQSPSTRAHLPLRLIHRWFRRPMEVLP